MSGIVLRFLRCSWFHHITASFRRPMRHVIWHSLEGYYPNTIAFLLLWRIRWLDTCDTHTDSQYLQYCVKPENTFLPWCRLVLSSNVLPRLASGFFVISKCHDLSIDVSSYFTKCIYIVFSRTLCYYRQCCIFGRGYIFCHTRNSKTRQDNVVGHCVESTSHDQGPDSI